MAFIFGSPKTNSVQTPAITSLQVQTSAYGKCVSFGYGTNRVAPELLWYGAFTSHATSTGGGGGKGGGGGSGSTSYTYTTSIQLALGEGPIVGVRKVWIDKDIGTSISYPQVPYPGFTLFTGSYAQTAWSYLSGLVAPVNGAFTQILAGSYTTTRNYYIQATFTTASGETLPNSEAHYPIQNTAAARTHYLLKVSPPTGAPAGATGWNLYVGLSSGSEKKQNATPLSLSTGWTELSTGLVNNGNLPVADTSNLSQALNYHGIAYLAAAAYNLAANPNLRNHNFEVQWSQDFGDDADASIVISSILTNTKFGTIFPSASIGSMTVYQNYLYASGLFISPLYTDQKPVADMLTDIAKMTNTGIVWSSGKLNFIPYGDTTITANGHTYTAPSAPLYDLNDDDFILNSSAAGSSGNSANDPIILTRRDATQFYNSIKLEYVNRANDYAPEIVEAKDQALIDTFGLYQDASRDGHIFCLGSSARVSVQLQLQREAIRNIYQFTVDQRYIGLDPMDIVSLTDAVLGLNKQWVRITEITENDDWTLTMTAEEYLDGTGHVALYDFQDATGFNVDYNVDPGSTNALIVFDAPVAITTNGGLETWIAVSGGPLWGGCDFYISTNNLDYALVAPRQVGPTRMGVLVSDISSSDTTITVNLGQSYGILNSGTAADATAGNTLCYLDGEFISYQTATLISPYNYTLTGCIRGFYGSVKVAHLAGTSFARLDSQIFKYPHAKIQIGQSLSIKPLSFNIYGGGQQVLS